MQTKQVIHILNKSNIQRKENKDYDPRVPSWNYSGQATPLRLLEGKLYETITFREIWLQHTALWKVSVYFFKWLTLVDHRCSSWLLILSIVWFSLGRIVSIFVFDNRYPKTRFLSSGTMGLTLQLLQLWWIHLKLSVASNPAKRPTVCSSELCNRIYEQVENRWIKWPRTKKFNHATFAKAENVDFAESGIRWALIFFRYQESANYSLLQSFVWPAETDRKLESKWIPDCFSLIIILSTCCTFWQRIARL